MLQLCNNGTGWAAISYPLPKPKAIKLLNVLPSWFGVSPFFTPARVTTREVPPSGTHQPLFVGLRVIKSSDFSVFLSPSKCLVPGKILVIILGAVAFEDNVDNKIGARSRPPIKPSLCLSGINPKACNCECHFAYCQGRCKLVVFLINVIY
jgi:hypothetical protein